MTRKTPTAAGLAPATPISQTVSGESACVPLPDTSTGVCFGIKFYTHGA